MKIRMSVGRWVCSAIFEFIILLKRFFTGAFLAAETLIGPSKKMYTLLNFLHLDIYQNNSTKTIQIGNVVSYNFSSVIILTLMMVFDLNIVFEISKEFFRLTQPFSDLRCI